jgi:hypothetical protein
MSSMVEELIGNEEVMIAIARAQNGGQDPPNFLGEDEKTNEENTQTEGRREDEEDEEYDYRMYKEYMDSLKEDTQ